MTTEHTVRKWDALDNPACENCHGLSRPIRPKPPCECTKPIPLTLEPNAKFLRHATQLPERAQMTREEFSVRILNKSAHFWKHVSQRSVKPELQRFVNSIESVERNGAYVHVVYYVGTMSRRWAGTLALREQRKRPPSSIPDAPLRQAASPEDSARYQTAIAHIIETRARNQASANPRGRPLASARAR